MYLPSLPRIAGDLQTTAAGVQLSLTAVLMARLLHDRALVGYALACGLGMGAMFAYIAGSSFVVRYLRRLAAALQPGVCHQCDWAGRGRPGERPFGRFGVPGTPAQPRVDGNCLGGQAVYAVVLAGVPGLVAILVPLFVMVASLGFVLPNAVALAVTRHPEAAGNASALIGVLQFLVGAMAAPLVGIAGSDTAVPMAVMIAVLGLAALAALVTLTRGEETVL